MKTIRILLATDEVSIIPDYAKQLFEGDGWFGDNPAPVTRGIASHLEAHGFEVHHATLETLSDALLTRAKLGVYYHAICLLTVRVWGIGRTLRTAVDSVRALPENELLSNGLRLRVLPMVIANPMNMLGNARKYDSNLAAVGESRSVTTQLSETDTVTDLLIRAISNWQAEVFLELIYAGYAISLDENNLPEVFTLFTRPLRESYFFGPRADVDKLRISGYIRLPKEAVDVDGDLRALEEALRKVAKLPKKQQEAHLQKTLEKHPILLTQGLYSTPWARRTLRHPDPLRQGIQPDFVMPPTEGWSEILPARVTEIKSSTKKLFHNERPTTELLDSLEQLMGRYARYYEDPATREEQVRVYGRSIERPQYALLIGRQLGSADQHAWEEARKASAWARVSLVTYDDLLNFAAARVGLAVQVQFRAQAIL